MFIGYCQENRKIPTFHFEAGNRCFDMRVPEEINRKIVDHTADVNLTYSTIAREYLLREGLAPDLVIKIGSPMKEVIEDNFNKIKNSKILKEHNLTKNSYFVVSSHRQENIETKKLFQNTFNNRGYRRPIWFTRNYFHSPKNKKKIRLI